MWEERIKDKISYKGIVAQVGDVPIFAETIYNKIMHSLYKMRNATDENNIVKMGKKLFKKELERSIDMEIIENYAKSESIIVTEEEVEKELKNTINKLGSKEKFNKFLKNISATYDSFKKDLKFNILARKVYQSIFSSEKGFFTSIPIDSFVKPEDIRLYYENNKDEFYIQPRIRAVWIVKKFKNNHEKKEIIKYMKTIINLCQQGFSFYRIHKIYSDEIQPKTFKLYPLNIFDKKLIAKIENAKEKRGFHIFVAGTKIYLFYIKKYIKGRQLSLFDKRVYENVYTMLYNEKVNAMITQIKKEIRKNISIKKYTDK